MRVMEIATVAALAASCAQPALVTATATATATATTATATATTATAATATTATATRRVPRRSHVDAPPTSPSLAPAALPAGAARADAGRANANAPSSSDATPAVDAVARPVRDAPRGVSSRPTRIPRIEAALVRVGPAYSPALVRRVIVAHRSELRGCGNATGRLVVAFRIGADGAAEDTRVASSTTNNAARDRCVVSVVAKLVFPRPPGGGALDVRYPFVSGAAAPRP